MAIVSHGKPRDILTGYAIAYVSLGNCLFRVTETVLRSTLQVASQGSPLLQEQSAGVPGSENSNKKVEWTMHLSIKNIQPVLIVVFTQSAMKEDHPVLLLLCMLKLFC